MTIDEMQNRLDKYCKGFDLCSDGYRLRKPDGGSYRPCVYWNDGKCKKFSDDIVTSWCVEGPCTSETPSNADRIRSMSDEELAEFLTHINPTNCKDCAFSHGWRCQPDRDDYSDFEKCKEGRRRWLQQPMKVSE